METNGQKSQLKEKVHNQELVIQQLLKMTKCTSLVVKMKITKNKKTSGALISKH
jgi:hypothetical protein